MDSNQVPVCILVSSDGQLSSSRTSPSQLALGLGAGLNLVKAFTLVELLVVITLIGIFATLVAPVVTGILMSRGIDKALTDTTGLLEMAKSIATSQNTFVWVGFANATNSSNNSELRIGAVRSKDGSYHNDPSQAAPNWASSNGANLEPITKLVKIPNTRLCAEEDLPAGSGKTLKSVLQTTGTLGPGSVTMAQAESPAKFTISGQIFTGKILVFTPQGQVLVTDNEVPEPPTSVSPFRHEIEIVIQPTHGATPSTNASEGVAVRLYGGSGRMRVCRVQ